MVTDGEGLTLVALAALFFALLGWLSYLKLGSEREIESLKERIEELKEELECSQK